MAWFDDFETRRFAVNRGSPGSEVFARVGGNPAKPALLLHSFPQSHVMWRHMARALQGLQQLLQLLPSPPQGAAAPMA